MNRPVHFEIHSSEPDQSRAFFERVLGWKFKKWETEGGPEYWLVDTGKDSTERGAAGWPGINGGLMKSMDGQPRTVNTVQVADVDAMAAKVKAAGGQVVVPRMAIPGVGWLVYCTEPTGNLFGMMQEDAGAK